MNKRTTEAKEAHQGYGTHKFLETWRCGVTPPLARWIRLAYHAPLSQRLVHRLRPRPSLHVCASNVAGPDEPNYLAGRKCLMQIPLGLVVHGCGLFCTAFSYNGQLFIGAATDKDAAPDVDAIIEFVIEEYEALMRVAGVFRQGPPPTIAPMQPGPQKRAHTNGVSNRQVDMAASMLKTEGPNRQQ